jgi:hypothetical protein
LATGRKFGKSGAGWIADTTGSGFYVSARLDFFANNSEPFGKTTKKH